MNLYLQNYTHLLVRPFSANLVLICCEKLDLKVFKSMPNGLMSLEVIYKYVLAYGEEQLHLNLVVGLLQL